MTYVHCKTEPVHVDGYRTTALVKTYSNVYVLCRKQYTIFEQKILTALTTTQFQKMAVCLQLEGENDVIMTFCYTYSQCSPKTTKILIARVSTGVVFGVG